MKAKYKDELEDGVFEFDESDDNYVMSDYDDMDFDDDVDVRREMYDMDDDLDDDDWSSEDDDEDYSGDWDDDLDSDDWN